eukprot:6108996-Heterocapsa_arctica.AAC.1
MAGAVGVGHTGDPGAVASWSLESKQLLVVGNVDVGSSQAVELDGEDAYGLHLDFRLRGGGRGDSEHELLARLDDVVGPGNCSSPVDQAERL